LPFIDILGTAFFNGTGKSGARTVTDGATTSGSTTITSATAAFNSGTDAGRIITGAGIPAGTTVASVTNSTTAVLSAAATATATGVSLTITVQKGDGNADYYVAATAEDSAAAHPSSAGHLAIAKLLAGKIAPLIGAASA
jgi:hypothetical protein